MKTFKEFKQMLDEDGSGIGGSTTNCTGLNIAGTGINNSKVGPNQGEPGVLPKDQPSNKKRKSTFPTNPVLQPMTTRANPNG
jgi:hypothetical protein